MKRSYVPFSCVQEKCGCHCENTGVKPAICELEQNKKENLSADPNLYKNPNRHVPDRVSPSLPPTEQMKLVHPGDPSVTGDSPGLVDPVVSGEAAKARMILGPVRDLKCCPLGQSFDSFQC